MNVVRRGRVVTIAFVVACGGSIGGTGTGNGNPPSDGGMDASVSSRVPKEHRPSGASCPQGRGASSGNPFDGGSPFGDCSKDSDCTQGKNGRCLASQGGPLYYRCSYDECFSDGDCAGNVPCECRSSAADDAPNVCLSSSQCRLDSDCGSGGYCSPSGIATSEDCGTEYHCHTPADTCIDDSDCTPQICVYGPASAHWVCSHPCYPPP